MNPDEFETKFHQVVDKYHTMLHITKAQIKSKYDYDCKIATEQNEQDKLEEIGHYFKKMSFMDKVEFLEKYIGRKDLMKFLEPHEITALRIMEWPYKMYIG